MILPVSENSVRIIGEPLYYSKETIIEEYKKDTQSILELLATRACGSYIIIDSRAESTIIITSPGYNNAYFDKQTGVLSQTLGNILAERDTIELNTSGLASYFGYEGKLPYTHPVETPISNVTCIRGGMKVEIKSKEIIEEHSYLKYAKNRTPTFKKAFEKATGVLNGNSVTLLFSGGKDSTALYLSLAEHYKKENINLVHVHYDPDGCETVENISHSLDINPDFVEHPYHTGNDFNFTEHISEVMGERFVDPRSPYHALSNEHIGDHIISGHNMDAMICVSMPKAPPRSVIGKIKNIEQYSLPIKTGGVLANYFTKHILPNIHYWSMYADHESFRKLYLRTVPTLFNSINLEDMTNGKLSNSPVAELRNGCHLHFSQSAVLMALLTKTLPSHVCPADGLELKDIKTELERLRNWWSDWEISTGEELPLIRFYHYASNVNQIVSCFNRYGKSVCLPTMWGPLIPIFLRPIAGGDVLSPKKEIRNYIIEKTGASYDDHLNKTPNTSKYNVDSHNKRSGVSDLIDMNYEEIRPENSSVKSILSENGLKNIIEEVQNDYKFNFDEPNSNNSKSMIKKKSQMCTRLINLELILSRNGF